MRMSAAIPETAPIVSGIAADILMLHPIFTPDQVKGALMVAAQPLRHALSTRPESARSSCPRFGPRLASEPEPRAERLPRPIGRAPTVAFDDAAWLAAAKASPAWDSVSWLDGWKDAAWSLVSWSDVSWSDVSWSDVSWSDVSWSDVGPRLLERRLLVPLRLRRVGP